MAKVIWRRPHRVREGNRDTRLMFNESPTVSSLHPKQDLDPLSRVFTAKLREAA